MNNVDKYVLHPFTTLAAFLLFSMVGRGIPGFDRLVVIGFVLWWVNFYFWYNRNVKGRTQKNEKRTTDKEDILARIARAEREGTQNYSKKKIALITKTVRGRLSV